MIATLVALVVFVVIGAISWNVVMGYQGVGICDVLGAVVGATLRGRGSRMARVLGGGLGGAVAGYFAVAAGEVLPPGTAQWALAGAAYGALFGLPLAALVGGLVGLLGAVGWSSKTSRITDGGRPADQPAAGS
jgi:hypothetical protein